MAKVTAKCTFPCVKDAELSNGMTLGRQSPQDCECPAMSEWKTLNDARRRVSGSGRAEAAGQPVIERIAQVDSGGQGRAERTEKDNHS